MSDPWGAYDNVGATAKYTVLLISSACKSGHEIPLLIRYQLPSKPEHVLHENVISVKVSGSDTTAPQPDSAALRMWNRLEVRIRDGARVKHAAAKLTHMENVIDVRLNDDGQNGDFAPEDSIFSGIVPNCPPGVYRLRVEAEDTFGNRVATDMMGEFQVKLPSPSPAIVR